MSSQSKEVTYSTLNHPNFCVLRSILISNCSDPVYQCLVFRMGAIALVHLAGMLQGQSKAQ